MREQQDFYTAEKYIKTVGKTSFPWLKDYEEVELKALTFVEDPGSKGFVDLGAGYGRIIPLLAQMAKQVIAIELNTSMYNSLVKRASGYKNVVAIQGDMTKLSAIMKKYENRLWDPVICLMQNTLGRIESAQGEVDGTDRGVLAAMKLLAKKNHGEVIISIFKQSGLKSIGIPLYTTLKDMVGIPDLNKCDFEKGIFVSKTGYFSKWWTERERQRIIKLLGGQMLHDIETPLYSILHIKP